MLCDGLAGVTAVMSRGQMTIADQIVLCTTSKTEPSQPETDWAIADFNFYWEQYDLAKNINLVFNKVLSVLGILVALI